LRQFAAQLCTGPGHLVPRSFDRAAVRREGGVWSREPARDRSINGYEYRFTIAVYGGKYFLPVVLREQ
jgi:hypothetical protein